MGPHVVELGGTPFCLLVVRLLFEIKGEIEFECLETNRFLDFEIFGIFCRCTFPSLMSFFPTYEAVSLHGFFLGVVVNYTDCLKYIFEYLGSGWC